MTASTASLAPRATPVISPSDDRSYRHVTLAANSLPLLLISDPSTEKCSCCLSVRVGHLSDPPSLPGLAHFLEHMLFMGSAKYPGENDYNVFLSAHGGSSNAYTATESTVFYFDVLADAFGGALDRFSRFFVDPLMRADAVGREVMAVDSENAKNEQNDMWRLYQLVKGLAREEHPFGKFGTGNAATLRDGDLRGFAGKEENKVVKEENKVVKEENKVVKEENAEGEENVEGEEKKEEGVDEERVAVLREALLDFHRKYYSANLMQVCMLGKESLDELEKMAMENFGEVANKDILPPAFPGTPYTSDQTGKILHVVPIKDLRYVELLFPVDSTDDLYRSKPTSYIAHLLGHEGAGSVLAHLKERGWANDLCAGGTNQASDFSTLSITIELTDAGLEHVDAVVEAVFAYVNMMRTTGPQEWTLRETQTVSDNNFRFLSKRRPIDFTQQVAANMHLYPVEHIISGPYKIYDYDPNIITKFVDKMVVENCIVFVVAKAFEGKTTQKEKWYGTDYSLADISPAQARRWTAASVSDPSLSDLGYPARNDLICTDFALRDPAPKREVPGLLRDTPRCRVFFKTDDTYRMPKLNVLMALNTGAAYATPADAVLTVFLADILTEHCMHFSYLASMADLNSGSYNAKKGIVINLSGYNHKLHVLLSKILEELKELHNKVEESLFERIKDKTSEKFTNFLFEQPYHHAVYGTDLCMEDKKWNMEEKMEALAGLTLDDLKQFAQKFLSQFHLEMLIHGNASREEADRLVDTVLDALDPAAPDPSARPVTRVAKLEAREYLYRFREFNADDANSSLEILYQIGRTTLTANATLVFVQHLLNEPAFNELRSQETLGYIVHTSLKTCGGDIKHLLVLIQSDSFDPDHCDARVEAFLARQRQRLAEMDEEEFATNVRAVVEQFRERCKNLGEESSRYWSEIDRGSCVFRKHRLVADEVEKLAPADVLAFYDRFLAKEGPDRRKISVRVYGKNHAARMDEAVDDDVVLIENPAEFKKHVSFFPPADLPDFDGMTM